MHKILPAIRRAISMRWKTQNQQFAKETNVIQDNKTLPQKPPNAWPNRVVIINDPENSPKLPETSKESKKKEEKNDTLSHQSGSGIETQSHRRPSQQPDVGKGERFEKRCQELEKSLATTMECLN